MKYTWRTNCRFKSDPQETGQILNAMRKKKKGFLLPEDVVDYARDPSSVIHRDFQWDDTIAAHEHRKATARRMIRSIEVIYDKAPHKEPRQAFINVIGVQQHYTTVPIALGDPLMREYVLAQALKKLDYWQEKYDYLDEFAAIINAIKETKSILTVEAV